MLLLRNAITTIIIIITTKPTDFFILFIDEFTGGMTVIYDHTHLH